MRFFLVLCLSFLLIGCSDSRDKYIGYWKLDNSQYNKIFEISKDGNVYLFNENVFNKKVKLIVLEESKDEFAINNRFSLVNFKLADNSTMFVNNEKYTKISKSYVDEIKKNIYRCEVVQKDFLQEIHPYTNWRMTSSNIEKVKEIEPKYQKLAAEIEGCKIKRY